MLFLVEDGHQRSVRFQNGVSSTRRAARLIAIGILALIQRRFANGGVKREGGMRRKLILIYKVNQGDKNGSYASSVTAVFIISICVKEDVEFILLYNQLQWM